MLQSTMSSRAVQVLVAAVGLGVVADLFLLNGDSWRLGLFAWLLLVTPAVLWFTRLDKEHDTSDKNRAREQAILMFTMLLITSGIVLRESEILYALSLLATLFVASLLAWRSKRRSLVSIRTSDFIVAGFHSVLAAVSGALLLLRDLPRSSSENSFQSKRYTVIGIVIAAPVILVLFALLISSDPVFSSLLDKWLQFFRIENILEHVLFSGFIAWIMAGWLRSSQKPIILPIPDLAKLEVGADLRLAIPALYSAMILLGIFILVQARAMFGGAEYVKMVSGLTLAEYARQGFFGLIVVAGMVLLLLLIIDWAISGNNENEVARFRSRAIMLIVLVSVVLFSAAYRMYLYVHYYGLSESRFFAAASILLLAAFILLFTFTVLKGQRQRLGFGVLVGSAIWFACVYAANPDVLIVHVNMKKASSERPFDAEYHSKLSSDAVPALITMTSSLPQSQCIAVTEEVRKVWDERIAKRPFSDWRNWSLSSARARRVLSNTDWSRVCSGSVPDAIENTAVTIKEDPEPQLHAYSSP